jgi:hypothetical protein
MVDPSQPDRQFATRSHGIAGKAVTQIAKQRNHSLSPFRDGGTLSHDLPWTTESRPLKDRKYSVVGIGRCCAANVRLHGKRALKWRTSSLKRRQLGLRIGTSGFQRHAEVTLTRGAKVGAILGVKNGWKISIDHAAQRRTQFCVRPVVDVPCHPTSHGPAEQRRIAEIALPDSRRCPMSRARRGHHH